MFDLTALSKTCAKHVSGWWVDGGTIIHNSHTRPWRQRLTSKLSPMLSAAFTKRRTQIVHTSEGKVTDQNVAFPPRPQSLLLRLLHL
jgi:hypothetical protein